jgi:RNA polymerase sigma-70 factor (ECF subfamily)
VKRASSRSDPDPVLIERAQRGDREALKDLLEDVSAPVRQWAFAHTGDSDEAADLAQDVCLLLLRKLPSFRGDSRFLTWLFTVTRNQALEGHRRRIRHEGKMNRLKEELRGPAGTAPGREAIASAADARIDRVRIGQLISTFVGDLPERQREVFQLSEFQGMSSPEIGVVLDLEPGAVRAALFKARRALRGKILDLHPEIVEEYLP